MIKMIVSDMDGTLLNSSKQLPKDFTEVYKMIQAADIRFVVASGRQYHTLVEEFEHLDHNIAFIAENGGMINIDGTTSINKPMKASDAKGIIEAVRNIDGANMILCGRKSAYIENTQCTWLFRSDHATIIGQTVPL